MSAILLQEYSRPLFSLISAAGDITYKLPADFQELSAPEGRQN